MRDDKILEIINRLDKVDDNVLRKLVYELICERNDLVTTNRIDPLTNVYNRRILELVDDYSAIVMCDIDNFKRINDVYGHDVGDVVIKGVANIIKNNVRSNDLVCRYGGDEFCIILNNCSINNALSRMNRIIDYIASTEIAPDVNVTISVGVTPKSDKLSIYDDVSLADKALYFSKNNGKNKATAYDEDILVKIKKM